MIKKIAFLFCIVLIGCKSKEPAPKKTPIGEIDATISGKKFPIWGEIAQIQAYPTKPTDIGYIGEGFVLSVFTFSKEGYIRTTGFGFYTSGKIGTFNVELKDSLDAQGSYVPKEIYNGFSIHSEDGDAHYASYDLDSRYENTYTITSVSATEITGSFRLNYRKVDGFQHPQFEDKYEVICKRFVAKRK